MLTVKEGVNTIFVAVVFRELAVVSYAMKTAPEGVLPLKENEADAWLVVPETWT